MKHTKKTRYLDCPVSSVSTSYLRVHRKDNNVWVKDPHCNAVKLLPCTFLKQFWNVTTSKRGKYKMKNIQMHLCRNKKYFSNTKHLKILFIQPQFIKHISLHRYFTLTALHGFFVRFINVETFLNHKITNAFFSFSISETGACTTGLYNIWNYLIQVKVKSSSSR